MGKQFERLSSRHQEFIEAQKLFFVGTARSSGKINISPKGMDSFRIIDSNKIIWLNLTGSGNETAAHLLESNRMTIMFCAFEGNPLILRLYGQAKTYHKRDELFQKYLKLFPDFPAARQIIEMDVEMVQTSCGFGIPIMEYIKDRTKLDEWAKNKGGEGIKEYWKTKNSFSLDGHPTGIIE